MRADDAALLGVTPASSSSPPKGAEAKQLEGQLTKSKPKGGGLWRRVVAEQEVQGLRNWKAAQAVHSSQRLASVSHLLHQGTPEFITFRNLDEKIAELAKTPKRATGPGPLAERLGVALAGEYAPRMGQKWGRRA